MACRETDTDVTVLAFQCPVLRSPTLYEADASDVLGVPDGSKVNSLSLLAGTISIESMRSIITIK